MLSVKQEQGEGKPGRKKTQSNESAGLGKGKRYLFRNRWGKKAGGRPETREGTRSQYQVKGVHR